ncbi:MAG TPA: nitrogen fixation protein NifS, partial [Rhodospirillaceae bacterium]|nr:nitrogen fixation protein NifS [Rhodospirillaceae bacterium]
MTDILDVDFCRSQFPLLAQAEADAYFESAGGSYVPQQVIQAMSHFMRDSQTQPEWPFAAAKR